MRISHTLKPFLISFATVSVILFTAFTIIAYGRGYRLGQNGSLSSTGLVVVQSDPSGAQIIINETRETATPATLTLPPGWYDIAVVKEGFQPWHKRVKVQGEVVAKAEALLLPTNPGLTALTANGALNPALSPDGSKLAYVIPDQPASPSASIVTTKPGVWVLDLVDKPLGLNRDARQLAVSGALDYTKATISWSPDSKEIMATFSPTSNYILQTDQANPLPLPVSNIKLLQNEWKNIIAQREKEQLITIPEEFTHVLSTAGSLLTFSPDETKILYEATAAANIPLVIDPPIIGANPTDETRTIAPNQVYVYDIKEDRNYRILDGAAIQHTAKTKGDTQTDPTLSQLVHWLPSSRHLIVVAKDRVEIMDYDGTNRRTAYAGPFWDSFAVPWASGGKIVILTNFNPSASAANNLYIVNLK